MLCALQKTLRPGFLSVRKTKELYYFCLKAFDGPTYKKKINIKKTPQYHPKEKIQE